MYQIYLASYPKADKREWNTNTNRYNFIISLWPENSQLASQFSLVSLLSCCCVHPPSIHGALLAQHWNRDQGLPDDLEKIPLIYGYLFG